MGVEGGDFYEDALYRSQEREQREEQGALDSAMQEQTDRVEISTDTQSGLEGMQANVERQAKVQETLSLFERFAQEKNIAGFDIFKNFIGASSPELQTSFIDRTNARNIRKVVETSGRFPVNEFEFGQAMIEGTVLEEQTQVIQETQENDVRASENDVRASENDDKIQESFENAKRDLEITESRRQTVLSLKGEISGFNIPTELKNSLASEINIPEIPDNPTQAEKEYFINEFKKATEKIKQIVSYLSSNNTLERNVLPEAYAQGPEAFQRVSESLVALDPSFESRIRAWEMTPTYRELPAEQIVRVSGALGTPVDEVSTEVEQSGNIFSLEIPGGLELRYDVVTNERSISIDGYSLESQIDDTGDYQTPKLAYMKVEQEHLPKLQKIITAGKTLESENISDENIAGIKKSLRSEQGLGYSYYNELGIDALTTAQDIQKKLKEALSEHDTPLKEARETYRTALMDLRNNYQKALKEKDEKTKEVLRFLESIGFTQIPQYITDSIINTINSTSALRSQLGMQEEIDLANGKLGYNKNTLIDGGLELMDKQGFISFMNTLLTGDPKIPVEYINESNILYHIDTVVQEGQSQAQAGKGAYQNFLQRVTGDMTFESRARKNLGLL